MTSVRIDELAAEVTRIGRPTEQITIVDGEGELLGFFVPAAEHKKRKYPDCPLSAEEIERRKNQTGGRTLEEILADWKRSK